MQQARLTPQHINFKKERDFSEKLDATFAFLNQNIRPIGKNLLFIAGPFALLCGLFYGVTQAETGFSSPNPFETSGNRSLLYGSLFGSFVFGLIAGTLVVAIVLRHIKVYVEEGHTEIETSFLWRSIWKDFFAVLGTSLFMGLVFIIATTLTAIPIGVLSVTFSNPVAIGVLMIILMFSLFVVMSGFFLLFPIRSIERKGVFSATSRMFRIISGKWLSTIGLVVVISLIQMVISMAFAIPTYIIMFLQRFHDGGFDFDATGSSPLLNVLLGIFSGLSMVGSFGLYSLLFIAISFQYFSLVERRYSSGLMERMENFGKQKPEADDYVESY